MVFLNKLNFRKKRFAVLIILLQISSLLFLGKISAEEEKQFVLWTFADIQPRNDDEREDFEITVEDVIKNKLQVDAAVQSQRRVGHNHVSQQRRAVKVKHALGRNSHSRQTGLHVVPVEKLGVGNVEQKAVDTVRLLA